MDLTPSQGAGIGVGTAGLLLVAAVVTVASSPPAVPKPPDPKKAAITVIHTADVGVGGDVHFTLGLHALGPAPPAPVRLVEVAGSRTALLSPIDCPGDLDERRWTGLSVTAPGNTWCFDVSAPAPGATVKGTIATSAAEVELTLGQRHNYWFSPFLVSLLGLSAGLLALWWPKFLRSQVLEARLQRALVRNAQAPTGSTFVDLEDKAKEWKDAGVSLDDRVDTVEWLIGPGVATVRQSRAELATSLRKPGLPSGTRLARDARAELADTRLLTEHLLDRTRKPIRHRYTVAADAVKEFIDVFRDIEIEADRVNLVTDRDKRKALNTQVEAARTAARNAPAEGLTDLMKLITALRNAVDAADVPSPAVAAARASTGPGVLPREPPKWVTLDVSGGAKALTALTAGVCLVLAAVALFVVGYSTVQTFGTLKDYFALFGAAAASATLASLVTFIGYWSGKASASEARSGS